jgi:hypothetical protein
MTANRITALPRTTRASICDAVDIVILLLTPVFLCIAVRDWIFNPSNGIDPYVYLGYFKNLGQYFTFFTNAYYGSRLPFIIPGYVCYKIFPPLAANYVLHLGFYYLAIFSLYLILRITVNRRAALLIALLMGFYPYFLGAVGWDYIDGAAVAYFLLTLLLLTLTVKSPQVNPIRNQKLNSSEALPKRHIFLLFLAGMSLAAMFYTNMFMVIMIPSLALYYLVKHPQSWSHLLRDALIASSGVVLATVLLCIVSIIAGGRFLFFASSAYLTVYFLIQSSPWLVTGYTWMLHTPFMVFPFFIFLTSLAFTIVSLIRVKSGLFNINLILNLARDNIFSLCHLLNFILFLIVQLLGKPVFQLQYYVSYLLPTAFLAAGAQLAGPLSRLSRNQFKTMATVIIVLMIGSYLIFYHTSIRSITGCSDSIWYVSAVLVTGALCLSIASKLKQAASIFLVCLALLFFASTNVALTATNCTYCACDQRQQNFLAVIKSEDIIRTYDSTGNLRFWYRFTEPLGNLYRSIASTHLWGYRLINEKFPEITEQDYPGAIHGGETIKISAGTDIVILSTDKDTVVQGNAALNQLGLQAKLIGMEKITQDSISFTMTFIHVEAY